METQEFLKIWHEVVATRDKEGFAGLLAEDVSMGAPPYWNRLDGRDLVAYLLGVIVETIEDFTYHRELVSGRDLALEFHGRVGEFDLQGIDLITLGDDGLIARLDVMIRPINAVLELRERVAPRMAEYLESLS